MSDSQAAASFKVPLWWIRAFEVALQLRTLDTNPFAMSEFGGLSPALTEAELNAFLVVIQSSQQQILAGQRWLKFEAELLQKNHPAMTRTKSFLFLRLIQVLRSLQVLPGSGHERTDTLTFFEKEEKRRDTDGSFRTMYRLGPMSAELILGYAEPYSEILRLIEGKPRVHRFLGNHEPLSLRPSVWLELSYLEQYIFLQLRKATLWESSSYRWDAVFGRGFDEFFSKLPLPKHKANEELSPFRQKMRLLTRVGRKLIDHGVIRSAQHIDYLAIDAEGDPLTVIWQLHESEARAADSLDYENDVARFFREQLLENLWKKIVPVFSKGAKASPTEEILAFWREIEEIEKNQSLGHLKLEGNVLLSLSALFLEWSLRAKADGILKLPGWFEDCGAVKIIQNTRMPLAERLATFSQAVRDQAEYRRDIEQLARASFAAPVTLRQGEILEYLATFGSSAVSAARQAVNNASAKKERSQPIAPQPTHEPAPVQKTPDPELRRQAQEELQKMREKDPKRYQGLKQRYLQDLEMEKKQIILEMKEKMQPQAFDDHLKYSLVKYMLDNPRLWQSEDRAIFP